MFKCRKHYYPNKKAAKFVAIRMKLKGKSKNIKTRVYKCDDCDGYHLTSYSAKSIAKMKDRLYGENKNDNNSF